MEEGEWFVINSGSGLRVNDEGRRLKRLLKGYGHFACTSLCLNIGRKEIR